MYIYNMYILITLYTTILNIKHKEAHIYIYIHMMMRDAIQHNTMI
jgi:hypothetical protein